MLLFVYCICVEVRPNVTYIYYLRRLSAFVRSRIRLETLMGHWALPPPHLLKFPAAHIPHPYHTQQPTFLELHSRLTQLLFQELHVARVDLLLLFLNLILFLEVGNFGI